jgi:hypothetical protein
MTAMAATEFTLVTINRVGAADPAPVAADVANGNQMSNNNGRMWLQVSNPGGGPKTFTVAQPNTQDGVASPGKVISVPAGATLRKYGPFPVAVYGQTVTVAHEAGSTSTFLAFQLDAS